MPRTSHNLPDENVLSVMWHCRARNGGTSISSKHLTSGRILVLARQSQTIRQGFDRRFLVASNFLDHCVKAALEVCCKVSCSRWRRDRAGQKKAQGAGGVIQCHWQG